MLPLPPLAADDPAIDPFPLKPLAAEPDDEPAVMGAGDGLSPMPINGGAWATERTEPSLLSVMMPYGTDDAGDMEIAWHQNTPAEVDHARKTFDAMKLKGYTAYKTTRSGEKGEVIRDFDPKAERITMTPRPVGG